MKTIPYGKQNITEDDIKAVNDVLKSDYLTQGPKVLDFEIAFSKYVGSKYAIAVSNGTAALHLCTIALGLSEGDNVITTPITFAASANCIRYCNGNVIFSDIDPKSYLLDFNKLEILINSSPKGSFKGIVAVNFAGRVCNLEKIYNLAKENNMWVIEDACHSPGGYFTDSENKKQNSGNGIFSDLSIFSFHPVKHIACGEGGMITTNSTELYKKLLSLRTHGITKNSEEFRNPLNVAYGKLVNSEQYPGWYMEMNTLGYNYRLTDIQSALGISQLSRAEQGIIKRRKIANKYFNFFKNKRYILGQSGVIEGHAYHLYIIEVEKREELYNFLREKGVFCQIHYFPCHQMPYYQRIANNLIENLDCSENYYSKCISLPIYPTLKDDEQEYILDLINNFYNE